MKSCEHIEMKIKQQSLTVLLPIIVLMMFGDRVIGGNCNGDSYGACTCLYDPTTMAGPDVKCNQVAVSTVQSIFKKVKNNYLSRLILTPNINDTKIIPNVIGNHSVGTLVIVCPKRKSMLIIDPAAFSGTKSVTTNFYAVGCDLRKLNWSFLSNFKKLVSLNVVVCSNFHVTFFSTIPSSTLTSLSIFSLNSVTGLNGFNNNSMKAPAKLPKGLSQVYIVYCYDLGDVALQNLLAKWVTPSSTNTLTLLEVAGTSLTKIPVDITKFNVLDHAHLYENFKLETIQTGAFHFNATVEDVFLDASEIDFVANGAFKGDFKKSVVSFYHNNLTTLNENAFKTMLQQMSENSGFLEVGQNPFDCSRKNQCGLAWLIRDNPSFLDAVWSARCSNGTYFYNLNPNELRRPNGQKCP